MTVEEALPLVAKILLKSQEEMRDKKQELELSVISDSTSRKHKILEREIVDSLTKNALEQIENEQMEIS